MTLRLQHTWEHSQQPNRANRQRYKMQPLETRLAAVVETATATFLESLDGEDRATAKLHLQKAAQAVDEAWQQTVDGHSGPAVTNPTVQEFEHPSSASQDDDDDDTDFSSAARESRLSAPQLQAQLPRLPDRTRLRRLKNTLYSKRPSPASGSTIETRVREVS